MLDKKLIYCPDEMEKANVAKEFGSKENIFPKRAWRDFISWMKEVTMCIGNVEPHFKIQNIKPNEDEIFSRAVPYHKTWSEGEKKPQGRKLIGPIRFTSSLKINTKDSRKNHEFDIKQHWN